MQTVEKYKVCGGKMFDTLEQARTHNLDTCVSLLADILGKGKNTPLVDNPHGTATRIIDSLVDKHGNATPYGDNFKYIAVLLNDLKIETESE